MAARKPDSSSCPAGAPATTPDGEALWRQGERLVRNLAPRYGFDPQEAEDLAGAFFLHLVEDGGRRLPADETEADQFGRWLWWRIRGFLSHAARARARRPEMTAAPALLEAWALCNASNVEMEALRRLEAAELQARLRQALALLPEGERIVFLLHASEGRKHREIANLLGISEVAVWKRFERGRKRLRQLLAPSDGGFTR